MAFRMDCGFIRSGESECLLNGRAETPGRFVYQTGIDSFGLV